MRSGNKKDENVDLPPIRSVLNEQLHCKSVLKYMKIDDTQIGDNKCPVKFDFETYEQEINVNFLRLMKGKRKPPKDRKD